MRFVKVLLSLTLTRSIFSLLSFLSAIQGTEAEALAPFLQTPIWSLKSSSWKSTGKELEQPNRLSTLKIMMILCYSKRNRSTSSNHSKSCYKLEYQYNIVESIIYQGIHCQWCQLPKHHSFY